MPQIQSNQRGALVRFLGARGITYTAEDVSPNALKPSQKEYSPEKVEKAKGYTGTERRLIISKDGYVADGHHQWLAKVETAVPTIPIYRMDAPILQLLLELSQFPSSTTTKKAMPNSKQIITADDVQETIAFLKRYRFTQAAEMMTATTKTKGEENGDNHD